MAQLQTTKTEFVDAANGVRFAYRRLGRDVGIPFVMHIHYRANMDLWDPLLINGLAAKRQVILFDQAGVGRTSGTVSASYYGWADDLIAFIDALGLGKIDLLGFSMGGVAVQLVALKRPNLVRKLVLAGTHTSAPFAQPPVVVWPREEPDLKFFNELSNAVTVEEGKNAIAYSFFYLTDHGRAAADEYWARLNERTVEPLKLELLAIDKAQRQAATRADTLANSERNWFHRLKELKMPVLVCNGDDDVLLPTSRSWEMARQIENAQLIIYPKAGHGFLWQYAKLFAEHLNLFLDGDDFDRGG